MSEAAPPATRVLLVEGDSAVAGSLLVLFTRITEPKLEISFTSELREALARIRQERYDLVLLNPAIHGLSEGETLAAVRRADPMLSIVLLVDDESQAEGLDEEGAQPREWLLTTESSADRVRDVLVRALGRRRRGSRLNARQAAVALLSRQALAHSGVSGLICEAVKVVADVCDADYVMIFEAAQLPPRLTLRAAAGHQAELARSASEEPHVQLHAMASIEGGDPVVVSDVGQDERLGGPPPPAGHGSLGGIAVRIYGSGPERPYGAIAVYADRERRSWSDDDVHFVESIANLLGAAIRHEHASHRARHDTLTGLSNVETFREHLEVAIARAHRRALGVAVLFLDVDHFKVVNDRLGHEAGDELLRQVSARMREVTRAADLVARRSGDEFLVLLPDLDGPPAAARLSAESAARKILARLTEPYELDRESVSLRVSIGGAVFPWAAEDADALIRRADEAMYEVKRDPSSRYRIHVHAAGGDQPTGEAPSLAARLSRAMERDELTLHFQPIVELASGAVVAVEALIRWEEPGRGLLMPADFIPLAEEAGVIETVDRWVLDRCCRHCRFWEEHGLTLPASVNVSRSGLRRAGLSNEIARRLDAHGLDRDRITIEFPEAAVLSDPVGAETVMRDFSRARLHVAVDDFGTGYYSAAGLSGLPIRTLKIDQPLIAGIPHEAEARAAVRAVIELAHSFGMTVVAEAVTAEEQREFLVEEGCELGQGELFSLAVPASEVERVVSTLGLHGDGHGLLHGNGNGSGGG